MAERKTGPVKPPVIDLTAREAPPPPAAETPPEPQAAPESPPETPRPADPAPMPPPRPQARLAMPWSAISIATIAGAVIGTGLTFLLTNWVALPSAAPRIEDPTPQIAELSDRATGLETRLAALEQSSAKTQISLDATIQQLDSGFADASSALDSLRSELPAPSTVDLGTLETELQALETRVDSLAGAASATDTAALTGTLAELQQNLASLNTRFAGLETGLNEAKAEIAAEPETPAATDIGPAVRLPLIVSGLETAFATGRAFDTELGSLTALFPALSVPPVIQAAAPTGLTRPEIVAQRFAEKLPDILAARAGSSGGDWTEDAIDWAKALLVLRPAGEIEGSSPDAVMSRLEAAMERRDFVAANALLGELPEPMRLAAGDVAGDIAAHAAAADFIAALRAEALAPAAEAAP